MQKENGIVAQDYGTDCRNCERYLKIGDVCLVEHGKKFAWEYCRDFDPRVVLPDYKDLMKSVRLDQALERKKLKEKKEKEKRKKLKEREEREELKRKKRRARLRKKRERLKKLSLKKKNAEFPPVELVSPPKSSRRKLSSSEKVEVVSPKPEIQTEASADQSKETKKKKKA